MVEVKRCKDCAEIKGAGGFYQTYNAQGRRYLKSYCKSCSKGRAIRWTREHPEVNWGDRARGPRLKSRYGLTLDNYNEMFAAQEGRCSVCGEPWESLLQVEHDHATGVVRSLACGPCNRGLGHFSEDPTRLRAAAAYLEFHLQTRNYEAEP